MPPWGDDGFAILRRALSVTTLRAMVERTYAALDAGIFATEALRRAYDEWDGVQLSELCMAAPPAVREAVGRGWRYADDISFFRRSRRSTSVVDWHCDAEAVGTPKYGARCVNVWTPLDTVGAGLPSLELVPGSHRLMAQARRAFPNRSDDWVSANAPSERLVPCLMPGDLLLFDHYLLHRTERVETDMPRLSCEFRFVKP